MYKLIKSKTKINLSILLKFILLNDILGGYVSDFNIYVNVFVHYPEVYNETVIENCMGFLFVQNTEVYT